MPDPDKIAAIRALLPATSAGLYLNAGTCGPLPAETQRAMDEQSAMELATGRAKGDQWLAFAQRMEEARFSLAAALVADPTDIALTHSTTDGINLALGAMDWRPGDRILTTSQEHPGVLGPLAALRARFGVEVEQIEIGDGGDADAITAAFATALERPAKAVVPSHVLWTTGAVLPVDRIAALARAAGARTIVDGAQSAGAIPVALDEIGADAYAVPGQKWLLGPEGMGGLHVRREFAEQAVPLSASYISFASFDLRAGSGVLHPGARRFEATGFHRPSVAGFARSLGWLTMFVGLPWALERAGRLSQLAYERLAAIPGVQMVSPRGAHGTLVTFRITGWTAAQAVAELGPRLFAIVRDLPPIDAIRISTGFWTTEEELERFAGGVELLAAHTPETIPPRKTLAVLGSDDQPLR